MAGSCFEADMQDPTIGAGLPKGICRMRTNGMTFTPDLASSSSAEPRRAIMLPPDAPSDPPPFWAMFRAVGPRTGWPLAPCCQDGLQQDCKQGTIEVFESPGSFPRGGRRLANFTSDCVALEWWSSRPSRFDFRLVLLLLLMLLPARNAFFHTNEQGMRAEGRRPGRL